MDEDLTFDFFAMGSPCSLTICRAGGLDGPDAAAAAIAEVRRIERRYSRYDPGSYLSEINRTAAAGGSILVDDETAYLIDEAFHAFVLSAGLFDVTSGILRRLWNDETRRVPSPADREAMAKKIGLGKLLWRRPVLEFPVAGMELDFGGLAKEYAADRAAAALCGMAARHGLVDLGGDIAIVGPHPSGSPWRIGVTSFSNPQEAIATLLIRDGAVATSGDYERFIEIDGRRFSHVIDPKTGMPVEGLASVTVVADTCLAAGIAATIGLLKATDGPTWLSRSGLEHLYLDRAGDVSGSIRLD